VHFHPSLSTKERERESAACKAEKGFIAQCVFKKRGIRRKKGNPGIASEKRRPPLGKKKELSVTHQLRGEGREGCPSNLISGHRVLKMKGNIPREREKKGKNL